MSNSKPSVSVQQVRYALLEKKAEIEAARNMIANMYPKLDISKADITPEKDDVILWKIFSDEVVRMLKAPDMSDWMKMDVVAYAHLASAIDSQRDWSKLFGFQEELDAINNELDSSSVMDMLNNLPDVIREDKSNDEHTSDD